MRKIFYIGSGILSLIIFFIPYIAYGVISYTPTGSQLLSTAITFTCDTGDTISYYDSNGDMVGGDMCNTTTSGTLAGLTIGTYTAVECLETTNCNIPLYSDMILDSQYVSEIEITWMEEEPNATSTVATGNIEFGLAIIITLLSVGVTSVVWRALYQNARKPWQK